MRITAHATVTAENVDMETRTITGIAAVYGSTGNTSAGPTIIQAGAVTVPDRVVMLVNHDENRPIGRLIESESTDMELLAKFRIAATGDGDTALLEAAEGIRDGLSVGLEVDSHEQDDAGNLIVTAGTLREISLVTFPAFTDARVTDVAASEEDPETPDADAPEPTESESETVDESTEPTAVETATVSASVPAARVQDPFPYGNGDLSFFGDMVNASHNPDAARRVRTAQDMMTAAQKTTDVAEVIPPGYRPDLYVSEDRYPMPIANSVSRMGISDATPFTIPVFDTSASLVGDHTEGVNPTDGTIAFNELTVSPKAVSGQFTASREMLDAANPNLDAIILGALGEAYARNVEAFAAAGLLAGAGTGTNAAAGKPTAGVISNLSDFNAARMLPADRLAVGSGYHGSLVSEVDGAGRPMNPYIAPSNASGTSGGSAAQVNVQGLTAVMAWALDAGAAVVYRSADHILFTSNRLAWRWEEKAGPANIVFAQFAYMGFVSLRGDTGALTFSEAAGTRSTSTK